MQSYDGLQAEADWFERALDRHGSRAFRTSTAAATLVHKKAACAGLGLANNQGECTSTPQSQDLKDPEPAHSPIIRSASNEQLQVTSSQDGLPRPRQFCNAGSILSCKGSPRGITPSVPLVTFIVEVLDSGRAFSPHACIQLRIHGGLVLVSSSRQVKIS